MLNEHRGKFSFILMLKWFQKKIAVLKKFGLQELHELQWKQEISHFSSTDGRLKRKSFMLSLRNKTTPFPVQLAKR